ncbi:hypothetical protein ACQ856_28490 [Mycolicibacterium psychrotolerans]|uniref:hypothetical protein n=1 Tax=Mycolicibacterium psychrotolerans TaxID=216929 RepID=UPI003D66689E
MTTILLKLFCSRRISLDDATILFVHGTGVRGTRYASTVREIHRKISGRGWKVSVKGCFWGASQGARLQLDGKSIPNYRESGGSPSSLADEEIALWAVLYTDPWYELRLLRNIPSVVDPVFGEEQPSEKLHRDVAQFSASGKLASDLAMLGLYEDFQTSLVDLLGSQEFEAACATAQADAREHRCAIARAIIAHTLVSADDRDEIPVAGSTRDDLVEQLTDELNGYGMGIGEFLLRPAKGFAKRMVTKKLLNDRGSITDSAAPMAGDVLRFLANGDDMRSFLEQSVRDITNGPVILIGHSLGGIMCADLLIRHIMPNVEALITVGSQAPFLYEIGALPCLKYPATLPDHMPRWVNIYDERDILSYVGARVFPNRVEDVLVDNGEPFPQAHSAYWSNDAVWDAIEQVVS